LVTRGFPLDEKQGETLRCPVDCSRKTRGDMTPPDSDMARSSLEGTMFLCQPLLEVLAGRGIEYIDAFLKAPSWNDLPDPFSIPSMEKATARVLASIRKGERITTPGDSCRS
jgi:hypothetical protein